MYNVHKLAELLEIQASAVVSRTIIDKPAGTVTLFAFDQEQGLSEHSAPFDAMVQALEGKLTVRVGGHEHVLEAGEMIVMPADLPHALRAVTPAKFLLTMIKS
jgi:quercetin dioxygenase-like cupin family protein